LVETDAPYLTPVPYRGKPNSPAYTYYTAEKLSSYLSVALQQIHQPF
jgi:TatD DNase family protein